jgi:CSLREA domain-containing protein
MSHHLTAPAMVKGMRSLVSAALLAALANVAEPPPAAYAATLTVNTSADGVAADGLCSLREAIDNANNDTTQHADCAPAGAYGNDIITFDAAVDGTPIVLGGAAGEDANASGDLDILPGGGDLTIQGNGPGVTIIDGGGIDRVFHICPAGACANTIIFSRLTIQNGDIETGDGSGGGICNAGQLTVRNSIIGEASAGNRALLGGGIYNLWGGTVTVDGSGVSANTAGLGGGIFNEGTLIIQNGSVMGGTGTGNQATVGDGGGIFNFVGTIIVDASIVSANTSPQRGGGIYNQDTLIVRNDSIIGGAGAGNRADEGGGIYTSIGATMVDGSTVSANTALSDGGGIYSAASLNILNGSTVMGNQANQGGGIYSMNLGTTTVTGSRILSNTATTDGGGVFNANTAGAASVTDSCIVGNSAASFLNNLSAQQTATGDWWGAATGPNTPGADTTGGSVDTSGFLTTPILGCPGSAPALPDLQVGKANDTGGTGLVGTAFHWTLTVANTGAADAAFTAGQRVLEDELPGGPTYGAPILGNFANITQTASITCTIAASTLTCSALGTDVTIGAARGSFDVTIPITPTTPGTLANPPSSDSHCWVDPDARVAEDDETNNLCPVDSVDILAPALPDLQVSKANDTGGTGVVGTAFHWTLTVANTGAADAALSAGQRVLEDELPGGPIYGTPTPGNFTNITPSANITCAMAANTLACSALGTDVTIGAATGSFDVTIPVTPTTPGTLTNPPGGGGLCRVDPDARVAEDDETNNLCPVDSVNVLAPDLPDLQVSKANDTAGAGIVGTAFHWTLTVVNTGAADAAFSAGQRVLEDDLPAGPTYGVPISGNFTNITQTASITCTIAANTLTCSALGANVTIGAVTGSFDVAIPVTPIAPGTLINPPTGGSHCRVDPDTLVAEVDETNNLCRADNVDITSPPASDDSHNKDQDQDRDQDEEAPAATIRLTTSPAQPLSSVRYLPETGVQPVNSCSGLTAGMALVLILAIGAGLWWFNRR